jgi:asparagine synthase (glutamine-hydrolysing)
LPQGHTGIETDERKYIDLVGKHVKNLIQTYVEAPGAGPLSGLEASFELEETIPNAFFYMDRSLQQAMQQKKIGVALSGFGGDLFVSHKGNFVLYQLITQGKFGKAIQLLKKARQFDLSYLQTIKTDYLAYTALYKQYAKERNKGIPDWRAHTALKLSFKKKYTSAFDLTPPKDQAIWMQQYISNGHVGRLLSTFNNTYAAYGIQAATPLLDKNIMEFMLDVPIHLLRAGGAQRGLLRLAMDGVLPRQVQWRTDKLPYSPDFVNRLIAQRPVALALLDLEASYPQWAYFEKYQLTADFDHLQSANNMVSGKDVSGIRVAQAIIATSFIHWLNEKGYLFE